MRDELPDIFSSDKRKTFPGLLNYGVMKICLQAVAAFAQTTHQSIYILDCYKRGFQYVSDNPLFLCGETVRMVRKSGYGFFERHVPPEELNMLAEITRVGFDFYYKIPISDRLSYTISFDFHLIQPTKNLMLINHKLTPLLLDDKHNIWLALCVVTHSPNDKAGNVIVTKRGESIRFEYRGHQKEWVIRKNIKFSAKEKEILALSLQGFTMAKMGNKLNLSTDTIKYHKMNIYKKLKVRNMPEALFYATTYNLFE